MTSLNEQGIYNEILRKSKNSQSETKQWRRSGEKWAVRTGKAGLRINDVKELGRERIDRKIY